MLDQYKEVQEQFNKVIEHSQNIDPVNSDELFEQWYEGKKYFIEKFNGLIWESPEEVTFPLNEKDRSLKLDHFINNIVLDRYSNYDLARFITHEKEGFYDNIVPIEYRTDGGTIIPKGMKIVRAFKFFEKDEQKLDELQTFASMLIQENKLVGKFCISVHPLDFISCSENQYNWHSCHALDGEYRAGNLSYMTDTNTVICYIKGKQDTVLPNFPSSVPWNNKKWRMWLYLADEHNALMAGRQYPFTAEGVLNYARSALFDLLNFSTYRWSSWHHDMINEYTYKDGTEITISCNDLLVMNNKFVPRTELITDKSSLHFNDLLRSSVYTPYYCWRQSTRAGIHFTVGGEVNCLCCNKVKLISPDRMACDRCDNYEDEWHDQCSICGSRHHVDYMYWVGDDHLCESCFNERCVTCSHCGEYLYRDDAYYDEATGDWYCGFCYHQYVDRN